MTLDGRTLCSYEHERLKLAILRTNEGNVSNVVKLKQTINAGFLLSS